MSSSTTPSEPSARAPQHGGSAPPDTSGADAGDPIDEASDESFPASDPPAWIFRKPQPESTEASGPRDQDLAPAVFGLAPLYPQILPLEGQMTWFKMRDSVLSDAKNAMLAGNWWIVALRGVFAILFGIGAFVLPGATILALVAVFAAFAILDGAFSIAQAVRGARRQERWGFLLLNGLVGIAIGLAAAIWPDISVLAFVFIMAAWALMSGAMMLGTAIGLKTSHGRWLLVIGAIVSMLYGGLLVVSPFLGALVLTWWIGAHAVVFGGILLCLAFRLRSRQREQKAAEKSTVEHHGVAAP